MGEAEDKTGDAGMFAIFIFSVVALGVIPMTIWRVSTGGGAKVQVVQPWRKVRARSSCALGTSHSTAPISGTACPLDCV